MAAVIAQPKQLLVRSARMVGLSRTAAARAAAPISASAVTMCKGRALVASPGTSSKKMARLARLAPMAVLSAALLKAVFSAIQSNTLEYFLSVENASAIRPRGGSRTRTLLMTAYARVSGLQRMEIARTAQRPSLAASPAKKYQQRIKKRLRAASRSISTPSHQRQSLVVTFAKSAA